MDNVRFSDVMIHFRDHKDRESWGQLYNKFAPRIREYLLKKVGPNVVDDCANEFWLNLSHWVRKYDPKRRPVNWLLYGAWFQAKRFLQKERRRESERPRLVSTIGVPSSENITGMPSSENIVTALDPHEGPEEIAIRKERCQVVRDAVASIRNPKVRDLAQKHFIEGRVAQEVADENGDKRGTAWYRLHEARKVLHRKLEPKLDNI